MQSINTREKDTSLLSIWVRRQSTRLPTFAGAIWKSCRFRFPSRQDIATAAVLAGGASSLSATQGAGTFASLRKKGGCAIGEPPDVHSPRAFRNCNRARA
jgi:hypothetical protein